MSLNMRQMNTCGDAAVEAGFQPKTLAVDATELVVLPEGCRAQVGFISDATNPAGEESACFAALCGDQSYPGENDMLAGFAEHRMALSKALGVFCVTCPNRTIQS